MGFRRVAHEPRLWSALSILFSVTACLLYSGRHFVWGAMSLLAAVWCGVMIAKHINRLHRNVNYLFSASVNGDFSYKFPVSGISRQEQEINRMLNLIVEHLEMLGEKIRRDERFLVEVINMVDTGIIVADGSGHVIHCNRAALGLLSVAGLHEIRMLPESVAGVAIKKTVTELRGERISIYTLTDISRVEQTAEVESWERLTRVLTHEIMNSLTPVTSIADSLGRSLKEGTVAADLAQQLEVITSSTHSLMDFVRNFRKINLFPEPKPQVIYLRPFLEKVVSLSKELDGAGDVDFRLTVFPPDTMVYTDGNLLMHVLINILKNAVEADARIIEIEAEIGEDENVVVALTNDGESIPGDLASQIFTPFFTTKSTGSGIGLSLSRRIVAKLGGTLTLSITPRTRFTISL